MGGDCDHCNLDRVQLTHVLPCMWRSLVGIYDDLVSHPKASVVDALTYNDRIFYVLGLLLIVMAVRLLTSAI